VRPGVTAARIWPIPLPLDRTVQSPTIGAGGGPPEQQKKSLGYLSGVDVRERRRTGPAKELRATGRKSYSGIPRRRSVVTNVV